MKRQRLLLLCAALATAVSCDDASAIPKRKLASKSQFRLIHLNNKLVFTQGHHSRFWGDTSTETIWTMNPDGTGQKAVWKAPKGYGRFGSFNSAGTQALTYNGFNLYLNDLKSRQRRHLFLHSSGWGTYIDSTSFSPDGKKVLLAAGSGSAGYLSSQVYLIDLRKLIRNPQESEKWLVPPPAGSGSFTFEPRFSPDGRKLVASVGPRLNVSPEMFEGPWNIWTLYLNGASPRQITKNSAELQDLNDFDKSPAFSSDGRTIAFVRRTFYPRKGESNDIWLVDADGSNSRPLTHYQAVAVEANVNEFKNLAYNTISDLYFSRDGKEIAFNQTGKSSGIYKVRLDGSNPKRIGSGRLVQWVW